MDETSIPRKIRLPSHVAAFRCAQCGECCTNKWRIKIDAVSFDKLCKKLAELGRQKELEDNFISGYIAPRFRFLPNGKCPYLSDKNLCRIQLELGGDYLFDICKVYPRHVFASQDALEFSLSLSCPTAVKTLQQGKITIAETDWPIKDGQGPEFFFMQPNTIQRYYPERSPVGNPLLPYSLLEDRFIELLQDRRSLVGPRMVALGQELGRLVPGGEPQKSDGSGNLREHLAQLFKMANIFLVNSRSPASSQTLCQRLLPLSADPPHPTESAKSAARPKLTLPRPDQYRQMVERYYYSSCDVGEGILENYLVNFVLDKSFYLRPPHLAYYRMAFAYAAIVAFSVGLGISTNRTVDEQTVLQAVYDVENIFYGTWFYPYAAATNAGKSPRQILERGLLLAAI
ncbi:MAG: flagellin lysine-N-methylase [Sporomusaceae bacterium]|nr:flagellin lysine-N-methylase [Sporomusaceae bacterium]